MIILISTRLPEILVDILKNRFKEHTLIFDKVDNVSDHVLSRIEIIISGGRSFPDRLYAKAKKLRLIQVPWIGVNGFEFDKLNNNGILLANSKWNTLLVAEFTLSLLLSGLKQIVRADRVFRQGRWESRMYTSKLLTNSNVLIIGFGDIATHLARLMQPYSCNITALKNNPDKTTEEQRGLVSRVITWDNYEKIASDTDIVIVTLPLTDRTESILNGKRLSQLKKGAYLVNIGRGAVIEEKALFEILNSNHLSGAAIDVWYHYNRDNKPEPYYPSEFDFHKLDNTIMSPHRASTILDSPYTVFDDLEYNIDALLNNRPLKNLIDLGLKY